MNIRLGHSGGVLQRTPNNSDEYVLLIRGTRDYRLKCDIRSIEQLINELNKRAYINDNELTIIETISDLRIIKSNGKFPILELPVSKLNLENIFSKLKP